MQVNITVRVDQTTAKDLMTISAREKRSVSAQAALVLERFIKEYRAAAEADLRARTCDEHE